MYVYIVLSHTGTFLSRLIRRVTHGEYSHASICLDGNFKELYSFGRLHCYNPIWGGYVKESPDYGTFKRFRNTTVQILRIEVTDAQYASLKQYLEAMYARRRRYHYNYVGLLLALFNRGFRQKNCYYCSEFVGSMVKQFHLTDCTCLGDVIRPMDLVALPHTDVVYTGSLSAFASCV